MKRIPRYSSSRSRATAELSDRYIQMGYPESSFRSQLLIGIGSSGAPLPTTPIRAGELLFSKAVGTKGINQTSR